VLVAISKDERFSGILHKFVPVSTNLKSKRARAENLVAAPLEMGDLYLNPDDEETPTEMKEWDPDNRKAKDGIIDSIGVGMALYNTPAIGTVSKDIEAMAKFDNERYQKSVDQDFGIPIEDVMAEDDWSDTDDFFEFDDAVGY